MAEETQAQETTEQAEAQPETDWQAKYEAMREHMRDWERKAKANQSAADELEKLKTEQMTEQEKANARAEKAEAELAELKAAAQKAQDAQEIASADGVPLWMLEFCSDREAMEAFAKKFKAEQPVVHAAATATSSRIVRESEKSNAQIFADSVGALLK